MIEPFEYEKTNSKVKVHESTVKNDDLDESLLDRQLENLNHFQGRSEDAMFLEKEKPFTNAFQDQFGRVTKVNENKSHWQSEAIAARGSIASEYSVASFRNGGERQSASVLIGSYLDREVNHLNPMMETVMPVENIRLQDPVLQPGITFIDSRKNKATTF